MAITQKELAQYLNVSQTTVADALNNRSRTSEKTRQRVLKAARELGYSPSSNHAGRSLVARRYGYRVKTGIVGIVVGGESLMPQDDPFIAPAVEGVSSEATRQGRSVVLCQSGSLSRPLLPWPIIEGHVDGIVAVNTHPVRLESLHELGIPQAFINWDDKSVMVPEIREGMKMATRHLIELGHRRIAYLGRGGENMGLRERYHIEERYAGYRLAFQEAGLPEPPNEWMVMSAGPYVEYGRTAIPRLLEQCGYRSGPKLPFSALVCYNDAMAMGAIRSLNQIGFQVPRDLSVVGCDNISADFHFEPVITSLDLDSYYMGQRVMQLLGEQIDLEPELRSREVPQEFIMPELVVHNSTRPYIEI